jgi:hypothetical protein
MYTSAVRLLMEPHEMLRVAGGLELCGYYCCPMRVAAFLDFGMGARDMDMDMDMDMAMYRYNSGCMADEWMEAAGGL